MKKFALTALAAVIALGSVASTAFADSRNNDDDDQWRRHGQRDGGDWDGRDDNGDRHARRDRDGDDEWRWRDRRPHWRHHHRPHWSHRYDRDVCWVKKVRRYDDWGNVYVKRIRVCQ